MTQIALEVGKEEAKALDALKDQHGDAIRSASAHGISGAEWLSFVVEMTGTLAPHVFALFAIWIEKNKPVKIIVDGERKDLTEEEVAKLRQKLESSDKAE